MSDARDSAIQAGNRLQSPPMAGNGRPETSGRRTGARQENMGSSEAWLSVAAGAGLVWGAWRSWSKASLPLAAAGASLLYRGSTRHCPVYAAAGVDHSKRNSGPDAVGMVTIDKPVEEVYRFWRDLRNAPRFMTIVDRVDILDENHSRWHTREIGGHSVDYEAEIIEDTPNDGIRWQSLDGAPIAMRGAVRFKPAPADRGTVVIASVIIGRAAGGGIRGRIASPFANYTIHRDLTRLKQLLEANEIPTTEGQPAGRADGGRARHKSPSHPPHPYGRSRGAGSEDYGGSWA